MLKKIYSKKFIKGKIIMKKTIISLFSFVAFLFSGYYSVLYAEWERIGLEGIEVTAIDVGFPHGTSVIAIGTKGKGIYLYDEENSTMKPAYSDTSILQSVGLFYYSLHSKSFLALSRNGGAMPV